MREMHLALLLAFASSSGLAQTPAAEVRKFIYSVRGMVGIR